MQKAEKRKNRRIPSINLLNYVSLDQNFREVGQGMGRTINMSETGLLIETFSAVNPEHCLSLNVGLADERLKVHGEVVYTSMSGGKHYLTGIRFNQAPIEGHYALQDLLNSVKDDSKYVTGDTEKSKFSEKLPLLEGPANNFLHIADEETYLYGEKIITQGNYGNWVWVVLGGCATVVRETTKGGYPIYKIGPGGFIGSSMSYLSTHYARTNSVIASEKIQLGLLDTQRMTAEHSALSPEFRNILISQCGRLKRIVDRFIALKQNRIYTTEDLLAEKVIIEPDKNIAGLHTIVRGKATILHRSATGEVPLVNLYPGDFLGSMHFIKQANEPVLTVIRASKDFEIKELNSASLIKEFEDFSEPLKNMLEFTALKIFTASQLVERISTKERHIN